MATQTARLKKLKESTNELLSTKPELEIKVNGLLTADPATIQTCFAKHFFPSEEKSDVCHQKTEISVDEFLAKHDMIDMAAPIVHSEMLFEAKTLRKKSAPGWNGVSTSLFLLSLPLLAPYILTLFNAWKVSKPLEAGENLYYPQAWQGRLR